jgi:hypothetical protein
MDVVIVYESLFGNTRAVAEAVGDGLRGTHPQARVAVLGVHEASTDYVHGADLLVVGGPTHILRMTTPRTRRTGGQPAVVGRGSNVITAGTPDAALGLGVREWLKALTPAASGAQAAAFDTRLGSVFAGGAASSISRRLRDHGYLILTDPKGFIVEGGQGPLEAGEEDRARLWGVKLARLCAWSWINGIPGDANF